MAKTSSPKNKFHFKKGVLSLLLYFGLLLSTVAQQNNIGIPFTKNYPNEVYQAGTQNWDIGQHPNGFLFFANNNGLLQFDGNNWTLFPLENKTIARSLCITQSGKIYVGGQGEFGYFEPNEVGKLVFHSIVNLIPKAHQNFADVWEVNETNGKIYFNASGKIFILEQQKIKVVEAGKIDFLGAAGNRIFFRNEKGLHELVNDVIQPLPNGESFANEIITDLVENEAGHFLFSTLYNGLFELKSGQLSKFNEERNQFFKNSKISCSTFLKNQEIVLGTANKGLVILDKTGRFLYQLNKINGLENNNILSVFKDKGGNLWLGLDNGIDYIATNSPFTKLIPDKELEGAAFDAKIIEGTMYLGTSTGLYQQDWKSYYNPLQINDFQIIKGSEGQVWGMDTLAGQLFMGHHDGGFLVRNNQLSQISPPIGNWKAVALKNHPNYYLIGTYEGLLLYKKENETWTLIKKLKGLDNESCRIIEQDQSGNIWISHPYRGIYKVVLKKDLSGMEVKLYGQKDGLPSNNLNHVFEINKEIIFTGEKGVFKYNESEDTFIPYPELAELIGKEKSIQRLFEDTNGNIWFVTTNETGILKINDKGVTKSFSKILYPELAKKTVRGFEFIYPYDDYNVLIGAEKGFIHFNPAKSINEDSTHFTASIVRVQSINSNDSVLMFGQYDSRETNLASSLPSAMNAFRFSYASANFESISNLQFATKLEGFDRHWSTWSPKTEKEFTNLGAGNYRFLVKAKSMQNQESEIASYAFTINPPWYASTPALIIYSLIGLGFLLSLILIPRRQFQEEKAQLESVQKKQEEEHLKQVAKNEEKIISLKNQQLETKIAYKNKELAMSTMHLVQRSELIQQIQDRLGKIQKSTIDTAAANELRKVARLLNENTQLDDTWSQFAHHFDQVHIDFLSRLRTQYPQLSANDQKLCAYLRMNLTTKEIAPLMNISIRGVEVARYRLRKKLDLDSTVNLNEFVLKV